MASKDNSVVVGLDIGRSAVKVAYRKGDKNETFQFPANVCLAKNITDEATAKQAQVDTVVINGTTYFAGVTAQRQGGDGTLVGMSEDWIEKPEYLALVRSAIDRIKHDTGTNDITHIVIGSPSSSFAKQRNSLADITKSVIDTNIKVLPQPSGAYFNHIFTSDGQPIVGRAVDDTGNVLSWGIIDLGHYTTDFLVIHNGQVIEDSFVSTTGIYNSVSMLSKLVHQEKKVTLRESALQQALASNHIKIYGQNENITDLVKRSIAPTIGAIISKTEEVLEREAAELDGIIVAGGAANFLYDHIRDKWPHAKQATNPRLAIAQGFLKYGLAKRS